MPNFYKAVVQSTAVGQDIVNVLYYAPLVPGDLPFEAGLATDLGEAIAAAWGAEIISELSNLIDPVSVEMSMVDEDGVTVSPFTVSVPLGGSSMIGNPLSTAGMTAIFKFNCEPVAEAPGHPVPRRSYIAVGPLTDDQVLNDGALSTAATLSPALIAATTQGHLVGGTQFVPYRVGRTEPPSPEYPDGVTAGVGRVVSGILRPYASFRRSRLRRPSGS